MITILIGTKGQLIKTSPIMIEMERRGLPFEFVLLGQHGEIIRSLIRLFDLNKPDLVLSEETEEVTGIASGFKWSIRSSHRLISGIRQLRGEVSLVHGDPLSALQGALLAKLAGKKLVHLEAGLRSGNMLEPFPEEAVRIAVDARSDYLVAPTPSAAENLTGLKGRVLLSEGNTVYDAVQLATQNKNRAPAEEQPYAIATLHRFENIMVPWRLKKNIRAIHLAAKKNRVLFPLHPSTKKRMGKRALSRLEREKNIDISPLRSDYLSFINLVKGAEYVITDGGGLQEETYYLGTPCLLLRGVTERPEGIGSTCLVSRKNMDKIQNFLDNYNDYRSGPVKLETSPSTNTVDMLQELGLL
jgi:UDP-N-acetylglucosamine 2-epimerase (non-hydrolysing)